MKKLHKYRKEHGAIMVMTALMMTVLIGCAALSIDMGMHYYLGARLQNAVDSAATAVAANLGSTDDSLEDKAYEYLAENGFDRNSNYSGKINVTVESKATVDIATTENSGTDEDYITAGYYKVTASIKDSSILGSVFGINSYNLTKTAYVKSDANYTEMPDALQYAVFGGAAGNDTGATAYRCSMCSYEASEAPEQKDAYGHYICPSCGYSSDIECADDNYYGYLKYSINSDSDGNKSIGSIENDTIPSDATCPTCGNSLTVNAVFTATNGNGVVRIAGRTSATTNKIVNWSENLINGINSKIVQPIKGWFGGSTDYNDLVHINLSETITNADVHSNANILIGVQALNVSRVKDVTYDGTSNSAAEADSETETDNDYDDYGQVTYTAVTNIDFIYSGGDKNTHVYVQNQQYLEQTQAALNILDTVTFTNTLSTPVVQSAYQTAALVYLKSVGFYNGDFAEEEPITYDDLTTRGKAIYNQYSNLSYNSATSKIELGNQSMIVYDVTQKTATVMLNDIEKNSLSSVLSNINIQYDTATTDTGDAVYKGIADRKTDGGLNYDILLTKVDDDGNTTSKQSVAVTGTQVNRDVKKIAATESLSGTETSIDSLITNGATSKNAVVYGSQFAVGRTFIENSDSIETPNMKPYFVRQIKNSLKNATTTSSNEVGSTSVKQVVASEITNLQGLIDESGVDDVTDTTYANKNTSATLDTSAASSTLLSQTIKENSSLTSSTTLESLNGFNLKDSDGNIRTSLDLINDFAKAYINTNATSSSDTRYGVKAIKQFTDFTVNHDSDYNDYLTSKGKRKTTDSELLTVKADYKKHYGTSAVAKKLAWIKQNMDYTGVSSRYSDFSTFASNEGITSKNAFLIADDNNTNYSTFITAFNTAKAVFDDIDYHDTSKSGGTGAVVDKPTVTDPDTSSANNLDGSIETPADVGEPTISFNQTISSDSVTYNMEDLLPAYDGTYGKDEDSNDTTIAYVVNKFLTEHPNTITKKPTSEFTYSSTSYDTQKVSSGYSDYMYNLADGYYYGRFSNPYGKKVFTVISDYCGFKVADNYKILINGGVRLNNGTQNVVVGQGAELYIYDPNNESKSVTETNSVTNETVVCIYQNSTGSFTIGDNSTLYIDGACSQTGGTFTIGNGCKVYINGYTTTSGQDLKIGTNSFVYINGDLTVNSKKTLTVGSGSTLIVTGTIDASCISADAASTIYAGAIKQGNSSYSCTLGNVYCAGDISSYPLTIGYVAANSTESSVAASAFVGGSISCSSITLSEGTKVEIENTITDLSSDITMPSSAAIYMGGDFKNSSRSITVSTNGAFCASNLTCSDINNTGQVCIIGDITVSTFTNGMTMYAGGNLTTSGTTTNNKNLYVTNSATFGGTFTNASTGTAYFNTIASGSVANEGNLKVNTTANFADLSNSGTLQVKGVAEASSLTVSGDNSNAHFVSLTCSGDISGSGTPTIYVDGNLTAANITNPYQMYADSIEATVDLENDALLVTNKLTVSGTFTNKATAIISGAIKATDITNSGVLGCWSNISLASSGTLKNSNILYVSGSINGRPSIENTKVMLVEGGCVVTNFSNSSGANANIEKTLSVTGTLTNSGNLKVGEDITGAVTVTNKLDLVVGGTLQCTNLINNRGAGDSSAILLVAKQMTISGDLQNGEKDYTNSVIYADTAINVIGSINNCGRIGVAGEFNDGVDDKIGIKVGGEFPDSGTTYIVDAADKYSGTGIKGNHTVSVDTTYANNYNNLKIDKDNVSSYILDANGDGDYTDVDDGDVYKGIKNYGNLYITSDVTRLPYIINYGTIYYEGSSLTLDYLVNDGSKAETLPVFACEGDLNIISSNNYNSISISNTEGYIYIKGDINAHYAIVEDQGELYALGDATVATVSGYNNNALYVNNCSKVYIQGWLASNSTAKVVYLESGTTGATEDSGTIISIFGKGHKEATDSATISTIQNYQSGSVIYLGTGTESLENSVNNTLSYSGYFVNQGTIYVYGALNLTGTAALSGAGGTYIAGDFKTTQYVSVSDGHILVCFANFESTNSVSITGDAAGYFMGATLSTTGGINVNASTFFAYQCETCLTDGSVTFSGGCTIYYPDNGTINLSQIALFASGNGVVTNADVTIDTNIPAGITVTVGGTATINKQITNNGNLYLVGDVKIASTVTTPFVFGSASDTYIGQASYFSGDTTTESNVLNWATAFNTYGTAQVYMDDTLIIKGNIANGSKTASGTKVSSFVSNRGASVILEGTSKLFAYGDIYTNGATYDSTTKTYTSESYGNAVYVNSGATFSSGGTTHVASIVKNLGEFIVCGSLEVNNDNSYTTDTSQSDMSKGQSIQNGDKNGTAASHAKFYVGGTGTMSFTGYIMNYDYSEMYINSTNITVNGARSDESKELINSTDYNNTGIWNCPNAVINFGGNVDLNGHILYNKLNAVYANSGYLKFGQGLFNLGTVVVTGDLLDNAEGQSYKPNVTADGSDRDYYAEDFSIMNGQNGIWADGKENANAILYCGGSMEIGTDQATGNGGSIINFGDMYIRKNLDDFTSNSTSFFGVAVWAYNNSNTFVGGDCFAGGGVLTGNKSIFMCDGNYTSKRSTKINIYMRTYNNNILGVGVTASLYFYTAKDDDKYTDAYFYVGKNMFVNTLNKSATKFALYQIPENNTSDFDVYSNTNIYVGGSFYTNTKAYLKQNVTMIVAGKYKMSETSYDWIFGTATDSGTRAARNALTKAIAHDCTFFVAKNLDDNICSTLIVNGSGYVTEEAKIRDMTTTYFYGDFNCHRYVELGKSLDEKTSDESQYKKYNTSPAYMFVGGDFQSGSNIISAIIYPSYTKIFARATLKVGGDFVSTKYLTLRHHAKIYVGKKLKAATSIEGGSYSEFYVNGSMQATSSFIKIRDCATCVVGGDMKAPLSYIELGKSGDYVEGSSNTNTVTDGDTTTVTCGCCDDCVENEYCVCGCDSCIWENGTVSSGSSDTDADSNYAGDEAVDTSDSPIVDTDNELASDETDAALGSKFYIGGALYSYTGYIKEFGYSQVIVGKYVFTPKYLTIRHNADLWVLPELFNNGNVTHLANKITGCDYCTCETCTCEDPYVEEDCTCCKDCTANNFWSRAIAYLKTAGSNWASELQEDFTLKSGSIYSMGELTLNKNASLMGTYDCTILGQTVLQKDSLVYMGHDFTCSANSANVTNYIKDGNLLGFESNGGTDVKLICRNKSAHSNNAYVFYVSKSNYQSGATYLCPICGEPISSNNIDTAATEPVTIYAYNNVDISTTIDMTLTYIVADYGDVSLYDVYSSSNHDVENLKQLPNAIASYQGSIDYFAAYGKIAALFYAPSGSGNRLSKECNCCSKCTTQYTSTVKNGGSINVKCNCSCSDCSCGETGVIDLDGYYQEIWGCILGNRVKMNTYYLTLHRFSNWRTMDLHVAESGSIYLISQKEYESAQQPDDYDDYDMYNLNSENGGANLFFNQDVIDEANKTASGQ